MEILRRVQKREREESENYIFNEKFFVSCISFSSLTGAEEKPENNIVVMQRAHSSVPRVTSPQRIFSYIFFSIPLERKFLRIFSASSHYAFSCCSGERRKVMRWGEREGYENENYHETFSLVHKRAPQKKCSLRCACEMWEMCFSFLFMENIQITKVETRLSSVCVCGANIISN